MPTEELTAVVAPQALVGMADMARDVYVNSLVLDYIARIVDATRRATEVKLGVSIRGAICVHARRDDLGDIPEAHASSPPTT